MYKIYSGYTLANYIEYNTSPFSKSRTTYISGIIIKKKDSKTPLLTPIKRKETEIYLRVLNAYIGSQVCKSNIYSGLYVR